MDVIEDIGREGTPISRVTDLATFDRRFAEVRERLLRMCIGLVGADDAGDVIHDIYLRSRKRIGQLKDPERFEAWVARTAVNECYNRHLDGDQSQEDGSLYFSLGQCDRVIRLQTPKYR